MKPPAKSPITLTFGYHEGYPLHNGVHYGTDFGYDPDNRVYAPFTGQVNCRPLNGDDGNAIYMRSGPYFVGLCHLSRFLVSDGQQVEAGQPLGIMGDTGAAEGVHLHFAVKFQDEFINPQNVIKEDIMPNEGDVINVYQDINDREATTQEIQDYTTKPWSAPDGLYYGKIRQDLLNLRGDVKGKQTQIDKLMDTTAGGTVEKIRELVKD